MAFLKCFWALFEPEKGCGVLPQFSQKNPAKQQIPFSTKTFYSKAKHNLRRSPKYRNRWIKTFLSVAKFSVVQFQDIILSLFPCLPSPRSSSFQGAEM